MTEKETELREKRRITGLSVVASLLLTALKLTIGLVSGSLGILAEAAHSGLDLIASILTFFAVKLADKPADDEHPYGHGRAENVTALIEAGLLGLTAAWIIYESLRRILGGSATVHLSVWAPLVMLVSIGVDVWRSRLLLAAGQKYRSQAMQADALNFRADLWTSSIVLVGLAIVYVGQRTDRGGLWAKADAIAALIVAGLVLVASGKLGRRAVGVLADSSPAGLQSRMASLARTVPGVVDLDRIRVRESGNRIFADLTVTVPRGTSLAQAHRMSEDVEAALRSVDPSTDAVVHVEPASGPDESLSEAVHTLATELGHRSHNEQVHHGVEGYEVSLHLELAPFASIERAHQQAEELEATIRQKMPDVAVVNVHLEPRDDLVQIRRNVTKEEERLAGDIRLIASQAAAALCPAIELYRIDEPAGPQYDVVLTCRFPNELLLQGAHERTEQVERALRRHYSALRDVVIHAEPNLTRPVPK